MRILVVAPDVGLPKAQEEAQHVINTHPGSHLVSGTVTTGHILNAIRGRDFDALWFICHANEDGLDLGADYRYGADVLSQMVRRTSARLLFLNACSTRSVAERIFAVTQIPVVCTRSDVMDEESLIAGRWFADELADGRNYREAFAASKLDNFLMIDGNGQSGGALGTAIREQVYRNRDQLWELNNRVQNIADTIDELRREERIRIVERAEDRRRVITLQWAVGFLIMMVLIILVLNIFTFYSMQSLLGAA